MAGREVLMHITNTPPTRRRSCHKLASPDPNTSLDKVTPMLTEEHDNQAERRERRKSRILELQRQQLQEATSPSSPTRRSSAPLNGLTAVELKDHYANCLKLSTENKITSKNAFGLHLIDYFADLVKKKQIENFQEASSTLDASAKIYAGRVDFIHNETLKVLSGLGRSSEKQSKDDNGEPGGADNAEAEDGTEAAKKKRRTRKSYTIETNLKNINVNKFDLEFEVDPMFKVMSAAFDEGGASGLLLNNLHCYDNNQLLVLDSTTLVSVTEDREDPALEPVPTRCRPVEIGAISEFLSRNKLEDYHVCPPFKDFTFTNWDMSDRSIVPPKAVSEHAFDMDAEPEPVVMGDGGGENCTFMDDMGDAGLDDDSTSTVSEVSNPVGDSRTATLVKSAFAELSSGMTGALTQILASKPSEFSFFDQAVLRSWAGPAHWRTRPLSKEIRASSADKAQRSKTKKPAFRLDFETETEFEAKTKQSKATRLTKQALESHWSKEKTTLPEDLHYTADKHFRLFTRPRILMRTQDKGSVNVDDGVETYNYDNTNDRENFVPGEGVPDNDDDDDDVEGFGYSGFGLGSEGSALSQNSMLGNASALNATTLTGDKLVAQPFKVAKIDISYAKTAKRIDVRKVKQAMWGILTSKHPETSPSSEPGPSGEGDMARPELPSDKMVSTWRMQEILTEMPKRVSLQTARNLSIPITFVCLLHLANEKVLSIENIGMDDLRIHQDLVA